MRLSSFHALTDVMNKRFALWMKILCYLKLFRFNLVPTVSLLIGDHKKDSGNEGYFDQDIDIALDVWVLHRTVQGDWTFAMLPVRGIVPYFIIRKTSGHHVRILQLFLTLFQLIIKIIISSIVIGLRNSYFPLIHLPSCYRTACYRTVQQTNQMQL